MNKFGMHKSTTGKKFYSRNQLKEDIRGEPNVYTGLQRPEPEDIYDDIVDEIKSKIALVIEKELETSLKETVGRKVSPNIHDYPNNSNNLPFIANQNDQYSLKQDNWRQPSQAVQPSQNLNDPWEVKKFNSFAKESAHKNPINHNYYNNNSKGMNYSNYDNNVHNVNLSQNYPSTNGYTVGLNLDNHNFDSKNQIVPQASPSDNERQLNTNNPITNQSISPLTQKEIKKDNSNDEKISFLEKELLAAYQRESKLKTRIDELELAVNKTESGLSAQIMDIKQDIGPTVAKPEENKLAQLSEQLASVLKTISSESSMDSGSNAETPMLIDNSTAPPIKSEVKSDDKSKETKEKVEEKNKDKVDNNKNDKKSSKKKYLLIFVIVIFIIAGIGGGVYYWMNRTPQVDPNLLKQYAPEGVLPTPEQQSDNKQETNNTAQESQPQVQGVSTSTQKYAESYADVDYANTKWETHKNPQIGVEFDYPGNSTNAVRTDTSVTILRKTGYIFKIQYIESALELDEYWNQVKARNLTYKVSNKNFRDYPALFLELAEPSDYPGDRYLVKKGEVIYDIWYATKSKNLSDDDAKRVDVMLNSLKFIS